MWFSRLNFIIPAFWMTNCTIVLGGAFAAIAWAIVVSRHRRNSVTKIPIALYVFTVAVCIDIVGQYVRSYFPSSLAYKTIRGVPIDFSVWSLFLIASFMCLVLSLVCLSKYSGPGKRTLWVGSIILISIDCLGFIAIVLALPGMPLAD
jgi:hypothetical protein